MSGSIIGSAKKYAKKYPVWMIILFCLFLLVVSLVPTLEFFNFRYVFNSNVEYVVGIAVAVPTLCLAIIAYINLKSISQSSIDQVVMALDTHWRSEQIIRARKLIDHFFQCQYRINGKYKGDYVSAISETSLDVYRLSKPDTVQKLINDNSNFIDILSLIEFFDTMGYLYKNSNDEVKEQIKILFKSSVKFYYDVCQVYIENSSSHDKERFKNFSDLYRDISTSNSEK